MRARFIVPLLILSILYSVSCYSIQFNLVWPGISSPEQYLQIQIFDINSASPQIFTMDNNQISNYVSHSYTYSTTTEPNETNIQYNYILNNVTKVITENFKRNLDSCRIKLTSDDLWITKNEYFNQSQLYLGLDKVPLVSANGNGDPPSYYDDNQVMTLSFFLTPDNLAILWDPSNPGEDYVKTNMSYISLDSDQFLTDIKIRRAGGTSLPLSPYSYQIKMNDNMNLGGIDRVFKLKAYPNDYRQRQGGIISEKTAADISYSLGAPINYVSYVRVYFNNIDQGLYGMLEKVDDKFAQRRWPYLDAGQTVGNLYKVEGTFSLLNQTGWEDGTVNFINSQDSEIPLCCGCYNDDCSTKSPDCNDGQCAYLSCCDCTWETNGVLEIEEVNCAVQEPFNDLYTLGNAIILENQTGIPGILNTESYLRAILAELAVMNADGYVYNRKNYYWYQDSVKGQSYLILYDQDVSFCQNQFVYSNWIYNDWTYQGNLADALFLPILVTDQDLNSFYRTTLVNFLSYYYRTDLDGPLYQRLNTLTNFVIEFNPERVDIEDSTESFQYFIELMSSNLQSQLNLSLPPLTPVQSSTCG